MNKKNMRAVADRIEQYPDKYDQEHFCGTAYCIAGHAVLEDGWKMQGYSTDVTKDEEIEYVESVAQDFLDLDYDETDILFDEDWKPLDGYTVPEQLRRYADGLDEIL